jgi:hypothetical protein
VCHECHVRVYREAYMAAALRHVRARLDDGLPLSIDRIAIVW